MSLRTKDAKTVAKRRRKKFLIFMVGNIGAAKTSTGKELVALLTQMFPDLLSEFVEESMEKFNLRYPGLFDDYYKEGTKDEPPTPETMPKNRSGYPFQTAISNFRLREFRTAEKGNADILIVDGSNYQDICFARSNLENGKLNKREWDMYIDGRTDLLEMMEESDKLRADLFIYMRPSVERCHYNIIHERKREEEKGISLQYLQSIQVHLDNAFGQHSTHEDSVLPRTSAITYMCRNENALKDKDELEKICRYIKQLYDKSA